MSAPAPWAFAVEGVSRVALVKDAAGTPIFRFYADRADEEAQRTAAAAPELRAALIEATRLLADIGRADPRAAATVLAMSNAALVKCEVPA